MVKNSDFMEPFLAKRNKEVYELKIVVMEKYRKVLEVTKVVDAYPGEIGKRYASNLLLRMGNSAVFGMELEKIPWEESKNPETWEMDEDFAYIKSTENGSDYILATAIWLQEKRKNAQTDAAPKKKGLAIGRAKTDALTQTGCTG